MSSVKVSDRQQRQRVILDCLLGREFARPADLVTRTGASLVTVHRDLRELARRGIVRRRHGRVSIEQSARLTASSEFRMLINTTGKAALARAASHYISPGMSVMLDDSTTVFALARLLSEIGQLTVVTNFRPNIEVLRSQDDIQLVVISGEYSGTRDSFLGSPAREMIADLSVDLVVQSSSAMTAKTTFHQEQDTALLRRAMLRSGSTNMLLMDASKLERRGRHRVAGVNVFDHVLLSRPANESFLAAVQQATDVQVVESAT